MAIVWGKLLDFCKNMTTYSNEQKLDLTYLWQKLRQIVLFKNSGNNLTKDRNKCE